MGLDKGKDERKGKKDSGDSGWDVTASLFRITTLHCTMGNDRLLLAIHPVLRLFIFKTLILS